MQSTILTIAYLIQLFYQLNSCSLTYPFPEQTLALVDAKRHRFGDWHVGILLIAALFVESVTTLVDCA